LNVTATKYLQNDSDLEDVYNKLQQSSLSYQKSHCTGVNRENSINA